MICLSIGKTLLRGAIALWLALGVTLAPAQVPQTIHYQGFLSNVAGQPVNATLSMSFALYDAASGGAALWSETQPAVAVASGVFSVTLGALTPIALPFNAPYWLGVTVGADAEMTPRQALASVPYALSGEGAPRTLTLTRAGSGTVVSSPPGVYCGANCGAPFPTGTSVTLQAVPDSGGTFLGWGGNCTGTSTTCTLAMTANRNVSANFSGTLSVAVTGNGAGSVISAPGGINCPGSTCSANFAAGTPVTLSASASASSVFTGWSGACSGTGACAVMLDGARNVAATFSAQNYLLAVSRTGAGGGTVTSSPASISCGATCLGSFSAGTLVTLAATPDASSSFAGWTGACAGTGSCTVTMDALKSVGATFNLPSFSLVASRTGPGTLTSSPAGIYCGAACSEAFLAGTTVTLTPVPDSGASFASWSGACSGPGACQVSMTGNRTVAAAFGYLLNVSSTGGAITSSPAGINCPAAACSSVFAPGTVVTLTQTPSAGGTFVGWSGDCAAAGAAPTCSITMDQAKNAAAAFTFPLTVTRYNNGGGTVVSNVGGINCGATCTQSYVAGSSVTLTATPDAGASFLGWTGCDSSVGTNCTVAVNAPRSVQARFGFPVTASRVTATMGTVSGPSGMDCGASCTVSYAYGDAVLLTATPNSATGFGFSRWTGCNSTSGTGCTVAATGARTATAYFSNQVSVNVDSPGSGTVTSAPAGISCSGSCSANFESGASVSLTQTPGPGATFLSWSGCDSVVGSTCNLTMNGNKSVTARYSFTLTTAVTGSSGGTIASSPAGINCGVDCSESYASGTGVTLTATPASGASFSGWSGDCTGTGACVVSMTASRSVAAQFRYPLSVAIGGGGAGSVSSSPAGIACGATCNASFNAGSLVVLTATPQSGSSFASWTNCPSPSGLTCTMTMTTVRSVTATFNSP